MPLDYALAAVLSIRTLDGELPPGCVSTPGRLKDTENPTYDIHNKKTHGHLQWPFKMFGDTTSMELAPRSMSSPNHQNLQYFSTMESLTR